MNIHSKRFDELSTEMKALAASKHPMYNENLEYDEIGIDDAALLHWKVKAENLLTNTCGTGSHYVAQFNKEAGRLAYAALERLTGMAAVFEAAKEDFNGGYLNSFRSLVQADVFSSELDQARELLTKGYPVAAAVIAGVVLETHLQELSRINSVSLGKMEAMNTNLVKKGVYNILRQKQITAHTDLRNKAAHGKGAEFSADDVKAMIADVERFIAG